MMPEERTSSWTWLLDVRFVNQPIQTTTLHLWRQTSGLQPEEDRQTDRRTNKGESKRASNQRSKQAPAQASKKGQTRTRNNIIVFACIIFISKHILTYNMHVYLYIYILWTSEYVCLSSARTIQAIKASEQASTQGENTQTQKTNASLAFVSAHAFYQPGHLSTLWMRSWLHAFYPLLCSTPTGAGPRNQLGSNLSTCQVVYSLRGNAY